MPSHTPFEREFGLFDPFDPDARQTMLGTLLTGFQRGRGGTVTEFNRGVFENQFDSFFRKFLGSQGQEIISGQKPTSFATFALDKFNERSLRRQTGAADPRTGQRLTSPGRFLFNR